MSSFKDFFFSKSPERLALPSQDQSQGILSSAVKNLLTDVGGSLSIDEVRRKKFAEQVSKLAYSEEFIEELSSGIADPLPEESEEDFVARAKGAVRALIARRLKV